MKLPHCLPRCYSLFYQVIEYLQLFESVGKILAMAKNLPTSPKFSPTTVVLYGIL